MADTPNINDVMNQIQGYIDNYEDFEKNGPKDSDQHQPTIGELDQFRKDWFYDDWQIRFRELNAFYPLGTKGVVAIPNTTFEEWLYWFQQWAIAFEQDYNKFKKLMFDTISLIEKHLEAIDKTLEDHEKRIQKLEQEVQDIYNKIQDIYNKIGDINNQINDIKNQITNLGDEIKAIQGMLGRYGAVHTIDFTNNPNGWYPTPNVGTHGFGISWAYLSDNNHQLGYQVWINLDRMMAKNTTIHDLQDLTIDMTQVAPDVSVRPMDVEPDYRLWLYDGYVAYMQGTGIGASQNFHMHLQRIDSNHGSLSLNSVSGDYGLLDKTCDQIEVVKGQPNPIITYINPNI